jgi:hypothetical protein
MEFLFPLLSLLILAFAQQSRAALLSHNFITTVDGFAELSQCAQSALSTIVVDQKSGCDDGGQATSWGCFCTEGENSSQYSGLVVQDVLTACGQQGGQGQVQLAEQVFNGYCQLGLKSNAAKTTGKIPIHPLQSRGTQR